MHESRGIAWNCCVLSKSLLKMEKDTEKHETAESTKEDIQKNTARIGVRHVQYLLLFNSTVLSYGMRTVLNVAIVAMIAKHPNSSKYPTYPEWASKKNLLLSSFFWGYICLQIGAGQLAKNYGPKLFLGGAIFTASLFSILVPLFGEQFGYLGVLICRVIQGLSQGFLLPSIHNLLSLWAPISERAKWGGIVYAGQALGNVFAMPITGTISSSEVGWPVVFYLYGGLGMLWCTVWIIFGSDSPSKHKSISEQERKWIEFGNTKTDENSDTSTPWKEIFTSLPFISIIIAHFGQNWGFWTLLTEIPSFMENVMGFDIKSNSFLSALPYFSMWLLNFVTGPIADMIIDKNIVSLVMSRKIFNTIGFGVPALALISLIFVGSDKKTAIVAILAIAVGFNASQYSGFNVNHIDLSPVHAGTLMAITNSVATIASILAPLSVDFIKGISGYNESDKNLWNIVFCTAAGFYLVTALIFIIFGSGDLQPWNSSSDKDKRGEKAADKTQLRIMRKISTSFSM